ncbi:hypothetical protein BH09MYX1_BH09MYX1_30570 [soil metagenome]
MTTDARFDADALAVGMALVPDLFSRNRMYGLFDDPVVRQARSRARLVRSVFRDLAGHNGEVTELLVDETRTTVRYRVRALSLERTVELGGVELAVLALLCERAGATALHVTKEQRRLVDVVLARLPKMKDAGETAPAVEE